MSIKIQMQDGQGNIIHPQTKAELVQYKDGDANSTLQALEDREELFISDIEPNKDGFWIDTTDIISDENVANENLIVKQIKKYINDNVITKYEVLSNEISKISNPNLLINGDFRNPVNQRNFSRRSYTGSNWTYGIDRWVIGILDSTGQSECILNDGYISLKSKANDGCINIYTVFENPQLYYGKTLTASFKYRIVEGQPNCVFTTAYNNLIKNGAFFDYNKSENKLIADGQWHVYTFTYTVSGEKVNDNFTPFLVGTGMLQKNTDDDDYTWVKPTVDTQIDIEWAKLEIGSKATPFVPRPYSEELSLCQRYYEEVPAGQQVLGVKDNVNAFIYWNFIVEKRINPTVRFTHPGYDNNHVNAYSNNIELANTPVEIEWTNKRTARMKIPALSSVPIGSAISAFGAITIDAEIY